jgi:hypothetical protein
VHGLDSAHGWHFRQVDVTSYRKPFELSDIFATDEMIKVSASIFQHVSMFQHLSTRAA